MKVNLHVCIAALALLFFSHIAHAQNEIPNPGFEQWADGNPLDWDTSNETILGTNFTTVTQQTTNPHSGTSCARVVTITNNIFLVGPVTMPGILTLGDVVIDVLNQTGGVTGGVPVTGLPKFLKGFYKYTPMSGDSAIIGIGLTRWNGTGADTVGYSYKTFGGLVTNWTEFSIPIEYTSPNWPDSMNIMMVSSNLLRNIMFNGSALQVDDILLEYSGVAVHDIGLDKQCFVYEGAEGMLFVKTPSLTPLRITIFSLNGMEAGGMLDCNAEINRLPVAHLHSGIYVAHVTLPNNVVKTVKFVKL